jgi:hypothetical protein
MGQRKYTLGERAIIYSAIAGGASLKEVNYALSQEQHKTGMSTRTVPKSSYLMVKNRYLPELGLKGLWTQIKNPKTIAQVIKSQEAK